MVSLLALVFAGLAGGGVYASALRRLTRQHDVTPDTVPVRDDAATLERGRHLVEAVTACTGCHGADLSGKQMADDVWLGRLWSANRSRNIRVVSEPVGRVARPPAHFFRSS